MRLFIPILVGVLYAGGALPVHAANTTVTNTISVTSSTGGNSANGGANGAAGTVDEGTAHASADITTTVNGTTVEDIHERSDGEPIVIDRTSVSADGHATTVSALRLNTSTAAPAATPAASSVRAPIPQPPADHTRTERTGPPGPAAAPTAVLQTTATFSSTNASGSDMTPTTETTLSPLGRMSTVVMSFVHTIMYVLSHLFS